MATALLLLIYIAFISLGLPDALLGAGWPAMQPGFGVAYGLAGILQMIISAGTIVSSIFCGRVLRRFGTGRVVACSVAMTAVALLGFGLSPSFWWLLLAAVPLGLGAGAVDAALNAFVAEHYESRHMSWLHSFWGVGALSGPLVLSLFLVRGISWRSAYLSIASLQCLLVLLLIVAVPMWAKVRSRGVGDGAPASSPHPSLMDQLRLPGAKLALTVFLFYCGIESSMGLWGGSYLAKAKGLRPAEAAFWVSTFYMSITLGRFVTGFVTFRVRNVDLIRWGGVVMLVGVVLMLAPLALPVTLAGFVLVGLGCAPIFPCMLHETPVRFGSDHAQSIMGVQMAFAYIGSTFLPPAFGFILTSTTLALLPFFLLGCVVLMLASSERLRPVRFKTHPDS